MGTAREIPDNNENYLPSVRSALEEELNLLIDKADSQVNSTDAVGILCFGFTSRFSHDSPVPKELLESLEKKTGRKAILIYLRDFGNFTVEYVKNETKTVWKLPEVHFVVAECDFRLNQTTTGGTKYFLKDPGKFASDIKKILNTMT